MVEEVLYANYFVLYLGSIAAGLILGSIIIILYLIFKAKRGLGFGKYNP